MYFEHVQQFTKMLQNLGKILDKAAAHAETKKFDASNYLTMRLAPDMFPLVRQVQSACDTAKFAVARLSGREAPRFEDNEKTFDELRARVKNTLEFMVAAEHGHFEQSASQKVRLPWMRGQFIVGNDYLMQFAIPNFYFHMAMTYALLREAGVDVGKMDFLGALPLQEDPG